MKKILTYFLVFSTLTTFLVLGATYNPQETLAAPGDFEFTVDTSILGTSANNQITLFVGTGSADIDWGDGNTDTGITGQITHTYANPGTYTIAMNGMTYVYFYQESPLVRDSIKVISIDQWGTTAWTSMKDMFSSAMNLVTYNASDIPNLTNVTDMSGMFSNSSFNSDISNWDVSNITNMSRMFRGSDSFNQDISNWNVSSVTDMSRMFENSGFSNDISNWDVSNITNMSRMFESSVFNSDISNWNVSSVTDMSDMFSNSSFNSNISNWNVSSVTDMSGMFESSVFNSDISNWNVSSVTDMSDMFYASIFNQDISTWDVSNVVDMNYMFSNSFFNSDISNWDVSSVTDMSHMFSDSSFNSNISNWDVSNVIYMGDMFNGAISFNSDISNWDLSSVIDMSNILRDAQSFSTLNYDRLLISLAGQSLNNEISFRASTQYCATNTERNFIISNFIWNIVDGGVSEGLCEINAPIAIAGDDLSVQLPNDSVTITGFGTDRNGTIASYLWTQVSGPNNAILTGEITSVLGVSGLTKGQYVFELTVTDNDTQTGTDTVLLEVTAAPSRKGGARRETTLQTEEEVSLEEILAVEVDIDTEIKTTEETVSTTSTQSVTSPASCSQNFNQYIEQGDQNEEVTLWQKFLNFGFNESIPETGYFGEQTRQGVKRFQEFFSGAVLSPWGITEGSGRVYQTTRSWANRITGCPEEAFVVEGKTVNHAIFAIPRGYDFLETFNTQDQAESAPATDIIEIPAVITPSPVTISTPTPTQVDTLPVTNDTEINMLLQAIVDVEDRIKGLN